MESDTTVDLIEHVRVCSVELIGADRMRVRVSFRVVPQ
jgi:hypothetical protein